MENISTPTTLPLHIPETGFYGSDSRPDDLAQWLLLNGAHVDIACVNWPKEFPDAPKSEAWLGHDNRAVYVLFSIITEQLRATVTQDLGPVASDTCFEIFLKPVGSGLYCNFEFNYKGIANVSRRPGRLHAVKFTPDELERIGRYPISPLCPTVKNNTLLLATIPLELIGLNLPVNFPLMLEGNLYSCCDGIKNPYFLSWAPVKTPSPDFHRPEFFCKIELS